MARGAILLSGPMTDPAGAFTAEEMQAIRAALPIPEAPLRCPRCGGALEVGYPLGSASMGGYWAIRCAACVLEGVVVSLPAERQPRPPRPPQK
ncbi:MAG TPA: hypothetical protein VNL18_15390 [Gemmatimonadales bacterium]|nr:hypothetical protein [Gemmatimonadales bacterium]